MLTIYLCKLIWLNLFFSFLWNENKENERKFNQFEMRKAFKNDYKILIIPCPISIPGEWKDDAPSLNLLKTSPVEEYKYVLVLVVGWHRLSLKTIIN